MTTGFRQRWPQQALEFLAGNPCQHMKSLLTIVSEVHGLSLFYYFTDNEHADRS